MAELPWREVRDLQTSGGWADLCNARGAIAVRGRRIDLVGVDDPHAERDSYISHLIRRQALKDGLGHRLARLVLGVVLRIVRSLDRKSVV